MHFACGLVKKSADGFQYKSFNFLCILVPFTLFRRHAKYTQICTKLLYPVCSPHKPTRRFTHTSFWGGGGFLFFAVCLLFLFFLLLFFVFVLRTPERHKRNERMKPHRPDERSDNFIRTQTLTQSIQHITHHSIHNNT